MIRIVLEYLDHKLKGKVWHFKKGKAKTALPTLLCIEIQCGLIDRRSQRLLAIPALLPQMLLLVPGTLHQVHKQECVHYGEFRNNRFSKWCCWFGPRHLFPPSSLTDSNIRKELLHLVQGRLLPPDEECYSVNHRLDLKESVLTKQSLCLNPSRIGGFSSSVL